MQAQQRQTRWMWGKVRVLLGVLGLLALSPWGHWLPVAEAGHITCGAVLGKGKHQLDSDVGPCPGPGPALTLGSGAPKLDLNGHTVSCVATVNNGIELVAGSATLESGTVKACSINVRVAGRGHHDLKDLSTVGGSIGFFVESDHNDFDDTTAFDNAIGYLIDGEQNELRRRSEFDGIAATNALGYFIRGHHNRLRGLAALDNSVEGYTVLGDDNQLVGTEASGSPDGYSFLGNNNKAIMNLARGNAGVGIGNRGHKNRFIQNTAQDNGLDLSEATVGCGTNTWRNNTFGTSQDGEPPGPLTNPSTCIK